MIISYVLEDWWENL